MATTEHRRGASLAVRDDASLAVRDDASLAVRDESTKEVTPVLTTNLRTTQTLDPTGVTAAAVMTCVRRESVTAPVYQASTTRSFVDGLATCIAGTSSFDAAWSFIERKPMPKVDLHPDRWPLHSTS